MMKVTYTTRERFGIETKGNLYKKREGLQLNDKGKLHIKRRFGIE
jgi:hypothetical protein